MSFASRNRGLSTEPRPRPAGGMRGRSWLAALIAGGILLVAAGAEAANFAVNSSADVPDANPGNGVCETAAGNGICTLRAAIQEANAHPGADTITLQASGPYTLTRVGADDTALNGDLDVLDSVTITGAGPGSTIIDGNGAVTGERVFQIFYCIGNASDGMGGCLNGVVVVSMSGLTIQHGASANVGGGLINNGSLTLTNCAVSNNTASGLNDLGGGIYNSGTLTLVSSIVSNNTTGAHNAYGGGIFNQGAMTITNSTISANSTFAGTSPFSPGYGGGIYNGALHATAIVGSTISGNTGAYGGGIYETGNPLVMINSTISGNHSTVSGGGLFANSGTTGLYNVTVTGNVANSDGAGTGFGGGVATAGAATLTFQNSIIALNNYVIDNGQFDILDDDDCTGTVTSNGFSIMYANNSGTCTVIGSPFFENPVIGPLQNNGGPTQTHALQPGSPAIDGGNTGGCDDNLGAALTADQRGLPRPIGAHCDIGAFEVQPDLIFKNGFQT